MIYGSVCSGIEAATVAWESLGWKPAFFSEIDKFPCEVLKHHYPKVPLHGDFTTIQDGEYEPIDILVGGPPCQDFSIAGLRKGIDGVRGSLTMEFLHLAKILRPKWILYENVPGILSSNGGRDFGAFLGGLAKLGFGFAYKIFNAQHFGVPQRRRRVFVVANFGNWRTAGAVLFEPESLCGNTTQSREKREVVGTLTKTGVGVTGADDNQAAAGHIIEQLFKIANCLTARMHKGRHEGVTCFESRQDPVMYGSVAGSVSSQTPQGNAVFSFSENQRGEIRTSKTSPSLSVGGGKPGQGYPAIQAAGSVRRLTPTECERLMGLPDNHTRIPWNGKPAEECPDGHRYRAIGNSMAVPVVKWIGERIQLVDELEA